MRIAIVFCFLFLISCKGNKANKIEEPNEISTSTDEEYELTKSSSDKALLILFPAFGHTLERTKQEFDIISKATDKGISVLYINYYRKFWIDESDSEYLDKLITSIIAKDEIQTKEIFIGGMSIGGNISLSLSNYLVKSNSSITPKGIFVVDSPIDLYALYESMTKDVQNKELSEERLNEPKYIINYFDEVLGHKASMLSAIEEVSPVTSKTNKYRNIKFLKDKQIRFYTEPDTLWLKKNRQIDFENSNSYVLQKSFEKLKNNNWKNITLIQTKNKGYRSNGERHPHSWSIVDQDQLLDWILN